MKLSYLQQGFGSNLPLVLLHPFPLNAHFWKNQLSGLSSSRHVIAPNFRGYGASFIESSDPISVASLATDVQKTLRNANISKAIFAGCSMGGYVLFELWRQDKELFAGMALIDTKAHADTEEARAKREEMVEKLRLSGTADLPDTAAGMLSDQTRSEHPEIERDVRSMAAMPECETVIKTVQMMAARPDSTPTLSQIDVPTLIIVGEKDSVTPPEAANYMHSRIAGAKLITVPGAGHYAPLENPAVVNQALADFCASLD